MAVTLETIAEKVAIAEAYFQELQQYDYEGLIAGYCAQYTQKLTCLNRLIRALTWDINGEYNTDTTQRLYKLLMQAIGTFSGAVLPIDPNVVIPGTTIVVATGTIMQTAVVYPGDGISSYTFSELIDNTVLTVYRGTGTTLRAHASAPDNEFVQFDSATGELTFSWAFADGESLWVEYRTTS